MTQPLLTTVALEVGYSRALFGPLDLQIRAGELWCLLGRNGAGKSTLVRTLLGLLAPLAGQVTLPSASRCAYLAQRALFDEFYPMSARDVILMGTERGGSFMRPRAGSLELVETVLQRFQLEALRNRRYRDLSEGQKQRVLLARVIASRPELAFFDEPTSAMDQLAEASAYDGLDALCTSQNVAVILVTHDLTLAKSRADRVLFLDDVERRVHVGSAQEIFSSRALRKRYGFAVDGVDEV